jgi:uncharacterized BrkB/YihY/UPF0761 family membrane protein
VSVARVVPETWELTGDDARRTLASTGRKKLVRDAFVRLRASDGFSHARSLAFLISLLLVQGVIVLVGIAAALGDTDVSTTIVRSVNLAAPGPVGKALSRAVFHAYRTGASGQYFVLVLVGVATLITGSTVMGQMERALNRLYGIEQDRPTLQKYTRAFVLAISAGLLATAAVTALARASATTPCRRSGSSSGGRSPSSSRWPRSRSCSGWRRVVTNPPGRGWRSVPPCP